MLLYLVFIPIAFFTGISASAIGYTAWSLIVPLFFVLFGFDLFTTLFISLLMDCANALLMTLIGLRQKEIDIKLSLKLTLFSLLIVIPSLYAGSFYIPSHTDYFRSSAGIAGLIIGLLFLRRGMKIKKKNAETAAPGSQYLSGVSTSGVSPASKRFLPAYAGISVMAVQTGLFGIGGGMGYSVFIIMFLSLETRNATKVAMFITFFSTVAASLAMFIQIPDKTVITSTLNCFIPVIISCSLMGTFIGTRITTALSEEKLNFLVAGLVIAAGTLATVQGLILN